MAFDIELTLEAFEDLRGFRKREQIQIVAGIEVRLRHDPELETRNRKRLRPNQLCEWELRIGPYRVFYDVDLEKRCVKVEAIGYKRGSRLYLHGEEYEL